MPVDSSDVLTGAASFGATDVAFKQFIEVSPGWHTQPLQPQVQERLSTIERPAYAMEPVDVVVARLLLEKQRGIARIQSTDNNKRLAILLSSIKSGAEGPSQFSSAGLYQDLALTLVCSAVHQRELLATMVTAAEDAADLNQVAAIGAIGNVLEELAPSGQIASVGSYYKGLAALRGGSLEEGRLRVEQAFSDLPAAFKSKALLALAACYWRRGDPILSSKLNLEALAISTRKETYNLRSFVGAMRNLATFKSLEQRDYSGALAALKQSLPVARVVGLRRPFVYYHHLNNIAAELWEIGRVSEAWTVIHQPLASPLARHYPNWRETATDIATRMSTVTRTVVTVALPEVPHDDNEPQAEKAVESRETTPAKVLDFLRWKKRMALMSRTPTKSTPDERARMSTAEKLLRIVDLLCREEMSDQRLHRALSAVEQIILR